MTETVKPKLAEGPVSSTTPEIQETEALQPRTTRRTIFGGREVISERRGGELPTYRQRRRMEKAAKRQEKRANKVLRIQEMEAKTKRLQARRVAKQTNLSNKVMAQTLKQTKLATKENRMNLKTLKLKAKLDRLALKSDILAQKRDIVQKKQDLKAAKEDQRELNREIERQDREKKEAARVAEEQAMARRGAKRKGFFYKVSRFVKPTFRKNKGGSVSFVRAHQSKRILKIGGRRDRGRR